MGRVEANRYRRGIPDSLTMGKDEIGRMLHVGEYSIFHCSDSPRHQQDEKVAPAKTKSQTGKRKQPEPTVFRFPSTSATHTRACAELLNSGLIELSDQDKAFSIRSHIQTSVLADMESAGLISTLFNTSVTVLTVPWPWMVYVPDPSDATDPLAAAPAKNKCSVHARSVAMGVSSTDPSDTSRPDPLGNERKWRPNLQKHTCRHASNYFYFTWNLHDRVRHLPTHYSHNSSFEHFGPSTLHTPARQSGNVI